MSLHLREHGLPQQILHDWDDGQCSTILRNIHRAAAPQSKLLIVEMLIPDRPEPSSVFLLDLSMLVLLGGRERTRQEFAALLSAAGYQLERIIPTTRPCVKEEALQPQSR